MEPKPEPEPELESVLGEGPGYGTGIPGFTPTGWEPLIEAIPDDFPFGLQRMTEEVYGVTVESNKLKKEVTASLRVEFSQRVDKTQLDDVDSLVAATPWLEQKSEAQLLLDKMAERQRAWLRKVEIYEERFEKLKEEIKVARFVEYPVKSEFTELPSFVLYVKDHVAWLEHTASQVMKSLKMGQMLRDPDLAALMEVTPTISFSTWKAPEKDKPRDEPETNIEYTTLVPIQTKEILAEQEQAVQKRVDERHRKRREQYRLERARRREMFPDRPLTPPPPPPPKRKEPPPYEGWEDLPPTGNVFDETIWPDLTVRKHMAYWVKYPDDVILFTQGAGTAFLGRLRMFFCLLKHDVAEIQPASTGLQFFTWKVESVAKDVLSKRYDEFLSKEEEEEEPPPRSRPRPRRRHYRDYDDMTPYDYEDMRLYEYGDMSPYDYDDMEPFHYDDMGPRRRHICDDMEPSDYDDMGPRRRRGYDDIGSCRPRDYDDMGPRRRRDYDMGRPCEYDNMGPRRRRDFDDMGPHGPQDFDEMGPYRRRGLDDIGCRRPRGFDDIGPRHYEDYPRRMRRMEYRCQKSEL